MSLLVGRSTASRRSSAASGTIWNVFSGGNIATAVTNASPGDTVRLNSGTYGRTDISRAVAPPGIVIEAAPGATVQTEGWRFLPGAKRLTLRKGSGSSLLVHETDETDATFGIGVLIQGSNSASTEFVTLDGVTIDAGHYGIRVHHQSGSTSSLATSPADITIRNCDVSGALWDNIQIANGLRVLVEGNSIHDVQINGNHNDGIQAFCGDFITLARNTIYYTTNPGLNPNQGIITGRGAPSTRLTNVLIENNLVYRWGGVGITVSGVDNVWVFNNTTYDAGDGGNWSMTIATDLGPNTNFNIANNVIEILGYNQNSPPDGVFTHNLIGSTGGASSVVGTNRISSSPLFTNQAGNDYTIQSGSPARSAANTRFSATLDRNGNQRDSTPDMGAFEYGATAPAPFVNDTFTDTNGTALESHTPGAGTSLTKHPSVAGGGSITSNRAVAAVDSTAFQYMYGAVPASANYDVECHVVLGTAVSGRTAGCLGRLNTTTDTWIWARYQDSQVILTRSENGIQGQLGAHDVSGTSGETHRITLRMRGDQISVRWNGVQVIYVTYTGVSAAGRVGVRGNASSAVVLDSVTALA